MKVIEIQLRPREARVYLLLAQLRRTCWYSRESDGMSCRKAELWWQYGDSLLLSLSFSLWVWPCSFLILLFSMSLVQKPSECGGKDCFPSLASLQDFVQDRDVNPSKWLWEALLWSHAHPLFWMFYKVSVRVFWAGSCRTSILKWFKYEDNIIILLTRNCEAGYCLLK